jgi:DNA mismatch repair protein MutS
MLKKYLFFALSIAFLNLFATPTIYKKIQPYALCFLEWEDEDWPNESYGKYLERTFNFQSEMQPFKKRKATIQIFDRVAAQQQTDLYETDNALYDMVTAQDINLLCGCHKEETSVAQIIDRTQTEFGKVFLYGKICNPITNIEKLNQQQQITKYLINNPELYTHLREIYTTIAHNENMLLSFYCGQDGFLQTSKRCYIATPLIPKLDYALNHSELVLEAKALWEHQLRLSTAALGLGATAILPLYSISLLANIQLSESVQRWTDYFQKVGPLFLGALITCFKPNRYAESAGAAMVSLHSGIFFKEQFDWVCDNFKLGMLLQKKLIMITQFFKAVGNLKKLLLNNAEFTELCPVAQTIINELERLKKHPAVNSLFTLLNSNTFKGSESIFSHQGKILVAYRLMHEVKEEFESLFLMLGELETYLSCATLYKEFENQRVSFCFADFEHQEKPAIHFDNFWNPLIDKDTVIPNTVSMGGDLRPHIILTGPNAGGKSALIKGLIINLILAQSIGMVAALKAVITLFGAIATYLNIKDDISSGNSLFKEQVMRIQKMIMIAEKSSAHKFSFIALDEMFNGTSAKESKAAAHSVASHLGTLKDCMCIIATHFPILTLLEKEGTVFSNYKVSVEINPIFGIHYPFKLEPGISQQHIALDILKQEGYNSSLVENAIALLNTI